ncbi:hypothetical protein [Halioxenophilus aromaticivorans]|uniref:hypothetical protein n=1 Tax=Halioxenophilus aromaticivorans TaxID=1306992 RepID=UPI0036F38274
MVVTHWQNSGRDWQIFAPAIPAFTPSMVLSGETLTASNRRTVGRGYEMPNGRWEIKGEN